MGYSSHSPLFHGLQGGGGGGGGGSLKSVMQFAARLGLLLTKSHANLVHVVYTWNDYAPAMYVYTRHITITVQCT